jgi:hypothetical protein
MYSGEVPVGRTLDLGKCTKEHYTVLDEKGRLMRIRVKNLLPYSSSDWIFIVAIYGYIIAEDVSNRRFMCGQPRARQVVTHLSNAPAFRFAQRTYVAFFLREHDHIRC